MRSLPKISFELFFIKTIKCLINKVLYIQLQFRAWECTPQMCLFKNVSMAMIYTEIMNKYSVQ